MASIKGTTRGTTPTYYFKLPFSVDTLANCEIYFSQGDTLILTKSLSDCVATTNILAVMLTQAETLQFDDEERIRIQVRFLYTDGSVEATGIIRGRVGEILKDGEIYGE